MAGGRNSQRAWPDDGVTRVPYFVYEDAELYQEEQEQIFRGPAWNYLGLDIEIPEPGDYITNHVGDTPVIVVRAEDGAIKFHLVDFAAGIPGSGRIAVGV